jgi:RHH-type proline utilization regulon transcriptional repressor/proline dehydrogenase/delta 1-pyrroline-5-carboxylate dehydrogenase
MAKQTFSVNDVRDLALEAIELAADILKGSRERESWQQKNQSAMMARMMKDEPGKKFTIAMADQVLRIKQPARAAERLEDLIGQYGMPNYFGSTDKVAFQMGATLADWMPTLVMPQVKNQVRRNSRHVIVSAEDAAFGKYLNDRKRAGVRVNFNQLGEAVLGDVEADRRLKDNIDRLVEPGVDYISVKLSSIVSQISLIGYQQTIDKIKPRLREVYRAAISGGGANAKFVNLDMEEYRDLDLTVSIFKSLLDETEFQGLEAGIVLQAYLPDSFEVLQELIDWAIARKNRGGAGIKIRLVKGANLAMEQVEASLEDWEQAPYHSKLEVDANFKRMLEYACRPEHAQAVRIGVGSHNLFDIAMALKLREQRGLDSQVEFEMLEGMANAQSEEVQQRSGGMLVYAPVVLDKEFEAAIAYLVRRLDENTAPGSFLGALFALKKNSAEWDRQVKGFLAACSLAGSPELPTGANRKQNRLAETIQPRKPGKGFENEPNTDFSLPENRQWVAAIYDHWQAKKIDDVPLQIAGETKVTDQWVEGHDPSRPGVVPYRYCLASADDVDQALKTAVNAQPRWNELGRDRRAEILFAVGAKLAQTRGDAIGTMLVDAGKAAQESDVEISEAVDFANYYATAFDGDGWDDGSKASPIGVVVVTPPWNFPYAIPAGGILAALMAGNTVILKPAPETVLTAWQMVQQLWAAGVPKDVLQFVATDDQAVGTKLVSDERVAAVILTGSIHTARLFQSWRPELKLYAETSGKNALIVTAAADIDLAVKDMVQGAFGHAGQKCSATSLALVERSVYENEQFRRQLKDAAASLIVAGAWDPSAKVTPIICPPSEDLERGLNRLDDGESWLLEPKMVDQNPCLWSPGIRMDVQPGSWYHRTECFGPVLGLICVDSLEEAIELQNSGDFGLTGGIHSLDPEETDLWRERVEVGNAYINRSTTGAIVRRQPFGGWKDSCVGPGAKAGGPNYVAAFCQWSESGLPTLNARPAAEVRSLLSRLNGLAGGKFKDRLTAAAGSFAYWYQREFGIEHDPSQLHGQSNHFRYRGRAFHRVRIKAGVAVDALLEKLSLIALACQTLQVPFQLSVADGGPWADFCKATRVQLTEQSEDQWLAEIKLGGGGSLRVFESPNDDDRRAANLANLPIVASAALANGRVELLNYLREQSISETVHRYGNIFE